jgi:SAM-dependent methyltransferase
VIAVEPIDEMRDVLERAAPEAEALGGTAEELTLDDASVDAVTAAQAFHWFDHGRALPEIHRVLRPGGGVGLIWNSRDLDDPLQERLDELVGPYRHVAPRQLDRTWRAAVDGSPLFGDVQERAFPWAQPITRDGLAERVSSTSVVAALPEPERDKLLQRVRAAAGDLDEPFPLRYRTDVFVFRAVD